VGPGADDANVPATAVCFIVDVGADFIFIDREPAAVADLAVADAADVPRFAVLYAVAFVVSAFFATGETFWHRRERCAF